MPERPRTKRLVPTARSRAWMPSRDRGLAHEQLVGGRADRADARHRRECLELGELEGLVVAHAPIISVMLMDSHLKNRLD